MGRGVTLLLCGIAVGLFAVRSIRARISSVDRWPGGTVRINDADRATSTSFRAAVNAWNTSGAGVRFVVVARAHADVVVEFGPHSKCGPGTAACAPVGDWGQKPQIVWLVEREDAEDEAHVLAHELGHVIGLEHSTGCTAMNPSWPPCLDAWQGHWRCRLLERTDISRAVALYGGEVRMLRRRPYCKEGRGL